MEYPRHQRKSISEIPNNNRYCCRPSTTIGLTPFLTDLPQTEDVIVLWRGDPFF